LIRRSIVDRWICPCRCAEISEGIEDGYPFDLPAMGHILGISSRQPRRGRRPTLKWNGYGEYVAHLYDGLEKERLFA